MGVSARVDAMNEVTEKMGQSDVSLRINEVYDSERMH